MQNPKIRTRPVNAIKDCGRVPRNLVVYTIESRQRLDNARRRTECTPSGEISGLCAVLQALFQAFFEVFGKPFHQLLDILGKIG